MKCFTVGIGFGGSLLSTSSRVTAMFIWSIGDRAEPLGRVGLALSSLLEGTVKLGFACSRPKSSLGQSHEVPNFGQTQRIGAVDVLQSLNNVMKEIGLPPGW